MSGGHFDTCPAQVGDSYGGCWEDAELNELFRDLFGNGWESYRGGFGVGRPRKMEFGRIWADDRCSGGLAETLDLWKSDDIDEETYREQVSRFKRKWLAKKTSKARAKFYADEIEDAVNALLERARTELEVE